ncbi:hypothetical protein LXA43DRAFT_1131791 [Ganoderma leucocontextum]|nr:hypothetical protein LXA43DRAFT_1131771 [Ganoderma leucocontextum]KAI1792619.1 hypothetical protein LXA43DRAFT_1131780 [Ganoderma leucocontextum]KAI1792622.1 hypothetical protein LXA43DRAFT_1131791 [Ganoderma leucocontextum]
MSMPVLGDNEDYETCTSAEVVLTFAPITLEDMVTKGASSEFASSYGPPSKVNAGTCHARAEQPANLKSGPVGLAASRSMVDWCRVPTQLCSRAAGVRFRVGKRATTVHGVLGLQTTSGGRMLTALREGDALPIGPYSSSYIPRERQSVNPAGTSSSVSSSTVRITIACFERPSGSTRPRRPLASGQGTSARRGSTSHNHTTPSDAESIAVARFPVPGASEIRDALELDPPSTEKRLAVPGNRPTLHTYSSVTFCLVRKWYLHLCFSVPAAGGPNMPHGGRHRQYPDIAKVEVRPMPAVLYCSQASGLLGCNMSFHLANTTERARPKFVAPPSLFNRSDPGHDVLPSPTAYRASLPPSSRSSSRLSLFVSAPLSLVDAFRSLVAVRGATGKSASLGVGASGRRFARRRHAWSSLRRAPPAVSSSETSTGLWRRLNIARNHQTRVSSQRCALVAYRQGCPADSMAGGRSEEMSGSTMTGRRSAAYWCILARRRGKDWPTACSGAMTGSRQDGMSGSGMLHVRGRRHCSTSLSVASVALRDVFAATPDNRARQTKQTGLSSEGRAADRLLFDYRTARRRGAWRDTKDSAVSHPSNSANPSSPAPGFRCMQAPRLSDVSKQATLRRRCEYARGVEKHLPIISGWRNSKKVSHFECTALFREEPVDENMSEHPGGSAETQGECAIHSGGGCFLC